MRFIAQNEGPIYECLGGEVSSTSPPSELHQRSSYNVIIVALRPYPVASITLKKLTLIDVAVKTGVENNEQVETTFMENDSAKYLVNMCKIFKF